VDDLLIRGACLIDGSGGPSFRGDLAVREGMISGIAPELKRDAKRVIEADGLALMPGIIDSHTHFDAQVTWDPYVRPSPALGVTSAVIGNCGFAIAPCKPEDRERTMRNLTQVEGMSLDVLRAGIRWDFESFSQYLGMLEVQGSAVNLAAYVGHSSVRTYVMGASATEREATQQEIDQMTKLVRDAMQAGAVGLASSTSPAHNGEAGTPMPSRLASDHEHLSLIRAMACRGGGVYMVTKGGQMPISFLEEMSQQSKRPVMIAALLHNSTNGGAVFKDLDAITAANRRGNPLIAQVSCCPLTMDFTLASPYPVEGLQSWKPALGLEAAALRVKLADASFRQAVKAELDAPAVFRLFNGEWDKVHIVEVANAANVHLEQCSLAELAAQNGRHPLDVMLDLALSEDLQTVFTAQLLNSDEVEVARMLNHQHSLVSLSDAGAHLTFFNDAGFGLHLLGHWVRDLGVMSLEQAAYKLTAQSAAIFGMTSRGLLRESYAADLLLFDPHRVGRGAKRRIHDLPGGAARLHTDALGVHGVWVNGTQVADDHGLIEGSKLSGQLMRSFDAKAVFQSC